MGPNVLHVNISTSIRLPFRPKNCLVCPPDGPQPPCAGQVTPIQAVALRKAGTRSFASVQFNITCRKPGDRRDVFRETLLARCTISPMARRTNDYGYVPSVPWFPPGFPWFPWFPLVSPASWARTRLCARPGSGMALPFIVRRQRQPNHATSSASPPASPSWFATTAPGLARRR